MVFGTARRWRRLSRAAAAVTAFVLVSTTVPANAVVPEPKGEYISYTAVPDRAVVPDECRNVAVRSYSVDFQGLGNEIQAQGFTMSSTSDPVYTRLRLYRTSVITGPGNFYGTGDDWTSFPNSTLSAGLELCPSEFDGGKVLPGTYTFKTRLWVNTGYSNMCHPSAKTCLQYSNLYERNLTYTVTVAAEINQACIDASAKVKALKAKIKKAKAKKLPPRKKRAKVAKLKRKLRSAKAAKNSAC